jgi:2,4-dienoyl-CoA reductase-like NADH-dependent reductase (Old Yellow Enzyme family)
LLDVARQIEATRQIKAAAGPGMIIVGSAYSYLQGFLPLVAQAVVRQGWADVIGLGRMMLSYPALPAETLQKGKLSAKSICRTFSDCTTAPRNGLVSGCYPLDKFYAAKPEAEKLKALKRTNQNQKSMT